MDGTNAPSSDPFGARVSNGLNKSCSNCFNPFCFGLKEDELVVTLPLLDPNDSAGSPFFSSALTPQMPSPAAAEIAVANWTKRDALKHIFSPRTYLKL